MTVTVTVRRGDDMEALRVLIEKLRAKADKLTVLEAPSGIDYSYAFPIVTVEEGLRHFGSEAVQVLQDLVR